jgi:BAH domain
LLLGCNFIVEPVSPPRRTMPRKSKTPRRSTSARKDFESESTPQTNGNGEVQDIKQEAEEPQRPRTNWAMVDPSNFPGFTIQYHTGLTEIKKENKKKRKRDEESERIMQDNPFDKNLSTIFSVKPADFWEDTSRYRKFTSESSSPCRFLFADVKSNPSVMNETFAVNDTVFIKSSEDEDPDPDAPIKGWVARVLEVRAGDEQHVYLRIYWLYRPEDLPGGRRDYHGRNELIASNDMQIIDAMTVNAKANVRHWVELEDKSEVFPGDQLFWRQTYNLRPKGRESPLSVSVTRQCYLSYYLEGTNPIILSFLLFTVLTRNLATLTAS